jgi:two-component system sensor histidine kinase MprB
MSFRTRLIVVAALAVAAAIAAASALVFVLVRSELRGQVDDSLREQATFAERGPPGFGPDREIGDLFGPPGPGFGARVFGQLVAADGQTLRPSDDQVELPVTDETLAVARGERDAFFSDETIDGTHVRLFTVSLGDDVALQVVRPLAEVDDVLHRIALILGFVAVGGIGAAAILGAAVARAALRPVRRLTEETELVAQTQDLARRLDVRGSDELSRLGMSFNTMLAALEGAQRAQRQLVADASHELRTPLTSLRTNIEVLARRDDLPAEKRGALLRDLVGQLEEMSLLVASLVELASEPPTDLEPAAVQLDVLVADAVVRARRLAPQVDILLEAHESVVLGVASRLERAVANLLDNAVKWSSAGGVVEVKVDGGEIAVRDHGPGIDEQDLPHVFDYFYRAPAARQMPGSGLGLSIVRQIAREHGGTAAVENAAGGGTRARLILPAT